MRRPFPDILPLLTRRVIVPRSLNRLLCVLALSVLTSCSGANLNNAENRRPSPPAPEVPAAHVEVRSSQLGAVQLHPTGDESAFPILQPSGPSTLTLAFDRIGTEQPSLSIFFEHTDRTGTPDLSASEALVGFDRDEILGARTSRVTDVGYVHYEYTFPNETIDFQVSGRYRLTVADGSETLLRIPFFVSEDAASIDLRLGAVAGGGFSDSVQPVARVQPGPQLPGVDAFQLTTCFVRNGWFGNARCANEPSLLDLSLFQFQLARENAFPRLPTFFAVDLGLLAVGPEIDQVDRGRRPPAATLDLDQAGFGEDVLPSLFSGQPVISAAYREAGEATLDGEYVDVTFRYAPPESRELPGGVYVLGAFNGWRTEPRAEMLWNASSERYEATLRIKQGRYAYTFVAPEALAETAATAQPSSIFTTLVYYRDPSLFTDRLVAVENAFAR